MGVIRAAARQRVEYIMRDKQLKAKIAKATRMEANVELACVQVGITCIDKETGGATGSREQLCPEVLQSEARRQKGDCEITRKYWN